MTYGKHHTIISCLLYTCNPQHFRSVPEFSRVPFIIIFFSMGRRFSLFPLGFFPKHRITLRDTSSTKAIGQLLYCHKDNLGQQFKCEHFKSHTLISEHFYNIYTHMHSSLKWKIAVWHKSNNVLCTIYIKTINVRIYIFFNLSYFLKFIHATHFIPYIMW